MLHPAFGVMRPEELVFILANSARRGIRMAAQIEVPNTATSAVCALRPSTGSKDDISGRISTLAGLSIFLGNR